MKIDKEQLKKKCELIYYKIKLFAIRWSNKQTWKDSFIPENPEEHPRLVRFIWLTFILTMTAIAFVFLISFTIVRSTIPTVRVPSVTQMDITEAITVLQSLDLQTHVEIIYDEINPKYQVIRQYPNQGSAVRKGREINLIISLGGDQYIVPKLCQLTKQEATTLLEQERIPYSIQVVPAGQGKLDQVVAMNLPIGASVPRDTPLSITITDNILKNQYRMDNFIRQPLEFAVNTLFNNQITPIVVTTNVDSLSDDGLVLEQNVTEQTIVMKNTSIILTTGLYAYNEGDLQKMRWHVFSFKIPRVIGLQEQIIITNEDGVLEDASIGEQPTAKFYTATLEDELGRTRTIYERMGAEGTSFIRVFKSYGKTKVYVFADGEIIGSREYGQ